MKTMPLGEESTRRWKQDSVGRSVIATPVVGVDDETAARGRLRMNVRFRQLNLVSRLDLLERNLFWILALHRTIKRAVVRHNS